MLYDGIHDVADLICTRNNCDTLYVFDTDQSTIDYLSALFRNDADVFLTLGRLDGDVREVAAGPLTHIIEGLTPGDTELSMSILLSGNTTRNAGAFGSLAKSSLVRRIEWRVPRSQDRQEGDDPVRLVEGIDRIFPDGYRADTRCTTTPGGRPVFTVTTWDFARPKTGEQSKASRHSRSDHRLFNVVYAHLRTEDIHAVHRGNVSVIWSRFPVTGSDLHLYLNAYGFTGPTDGLDVLLLSEPVIVLPGQYDDDIWRHFDHVITLYDHLLETRGNFSKNLYPRSGLNVSTSHADAASTTDPRERQEKYPLEERINGIILVNGNKHSRVPGELYSKRIEAALWFHNNSNLPFHVYGTPPFFLPNYRGAIPTGSRLATVARYRYCLCFENTNHPVLSYGYVEKILDCMETRTIPVYLGAPNIDRYIPEDCYIDFRRFKDYAELDLYLTSMSHEEYLQYIESIDTWVASGALSRYTWDSLYDRMISFYSAAKGIPLASLAHRDEAWAWGMSPSAGTVNLTETGGTHFWSFRDLALKGSPLVTDEGRRDAFEQRMPNTQRLERIQTLASSGSIREAVDEFSRLEWEGVGDHHYQLGQLLLQADDRDAAKIHFETAISLDPKHSYAHNDIAGILFAEGNIDKCVEHYHRAVLADLENDCALENLINILTRLGFAPYAQSFIDDCMKRSPGSKTITDIANRYGLNPALPEAGTSGLPDSAAKCSAGSSNENKDSGNLSDPQENPDADSTTLYEEILRVIAVQQKGDLESARDALQPLLSREPGNADVRYLSAQLFSAAGDVKAAISELAETVRLDPGHSNALNDLGCIAFQEGKHQEAFEATKKAIISDGTNHKALQNMLVLLCHLRSQGQPVDVVNIVRGLYPKGFRDIGANNGAATKRALIIYADEAIPWSLAGMLERFPYFIGHSMWWETAEMVRLLNRRGYIVDYIGLPLQHLVDTDWDWERYDLIIDGGENNLLKCPSSLGAAKVFYSTGKHWLFANIAEARRNLMFYRRHGFHIPLERTQKNNFSDENADYLTYFGNKPQLEGYSSKPKKIPLNISCTHIPPNRVKDIPAARKNYIWLGGQAMVHKGLDLVTEAFARMPEFALHICAHLEIEPRFLNWLRGYVKKYPNIIYHGPQNVASTEFQELAWNSIGTVYVSAAEGGPGSVAQLLHFGIIPIVTSTSNVRAENLGHIIDEKEDHAIIDGIIRAAGIIAETSDSILLQRCKRIREFASANHTREAYSKSFNNLLLEVNRAAIRKNDPPPATDISSQRMTT